MKGNVFKFIFGNYCVYAVSACFMFFLSVIFSVEQFGRLNAAISLFLILLGVSQFGITTNVINELCTRTKKGFEEKSILFLRLFACIVIALIACIFLNYLYYVPIVSENLFIFFTGILITNIFLTFQLFNQSNLLFDRYNLLNFLNAIFKLVLLIVIFYFFNSRFYFEPTFIFFMYVLSPVLFLPILIKKRIFKSKFNYKFAKRLVDKSKWIFVSTILVSILQRSDVLIVQKLFDDQILGFYSFQAFMVFIFTMLIASLNVYLLPIYLKDKANFEIIYKKVFWYFSWGILTSFIVIPILIFSFFPKYLESIPFFMIQIPSLIFSYLAIKPSIKLIENNSFFKLTMSNFFQLILFFIIIIFTLNIFGCFAVVLAVIIQRIFGYFNLSAYAKKI